MSELSDGLLQKIRIPALGQGYVTAPRHWTLHKFCEICKVVGGSQPPKGVFESEPLEGYIRLLQIRDFKTDKFKTHIPLSLARRTCKEDDIMIGRYGPPIFQILRGLSGAYNVALMKAVPYEHLVDREFLYLYLHNPLLKGYVEASSLRTAGQSGVNKEHLDKYPVLLPPLNEQRRIVARIEELSARSKSAKEALQAIPPLLEKFRQSVLAAAFRGDLTADWRQQNPDVEPAEVLLERIRVERRRRWEESGAKGKYVEPEPVDATGLPELPRGWCWARLENFCLLIQDGNYGSFYPKEENWQESGIPFFTSASIGIEGEIDWDTVKYITPDKQSELKKAQLKSGDVVFPNRGARDSQLYGGQPFAVLLPENCIPGNINPQLTLARSIPTLVAPTYLEMVLNSPGFLKQVRKAGSGSALSFVNLTKTKEMIVPVAPPGEQEILVTVLSEALSSLTNLKLATRSYSQGIVQLNQSILSKAFRGELVPQDPNDEPASVLLERIRAQRAQQPAAKKKRK